MSDVIPVLTIDGPGGVGKGTTSRLLARRLGWSLLDSGSLYRAVALSAFNHSIDFKDEKKLAVLAQHLDLAFAVQEGGQVMTMLGGENVNQALRSEETGERASQIAAFPEVRAALLDRQRAFLQPPGLVADGRDMGTVIFPDAEVKVFLTASAEERAKRRHEQLRAQGGDVTLGQLLLEIQTRDERDMTRAVAPLKPASDALVIDTTIRGIDEVCEMVFSHVCSTLNL